MWSGASLRRVPSRTASLFRPMEEQMSENEGTLPYTNTSEPKSPIRHRSDSSKSGFPLDTTTATMSTISTDGQSGGESAIPARRGRFAGAVRAVMASAAVGHAGPTSPFTPQRTNSGTLPGGTTEVSHGTPVSDPMVPLRGSRVAALIPKLKSLETTQDLAAHQALVRHLQFSPNGKFLATSRYLLSLYITFNNDIN